MNARAPGIAIWSGVVEPVYYIVKTSRYWVLQLPCPEASYINLRRWWFVYEQYSNPHYRMLCRQLAIAIADILAENNIREFKLIGLGLSPSCGYRETQSDPSWGGRPREIDVKTNIRSGKGVWIEVLEDIFTKYGFNFKVYDLSPAIIYPENRAKYTHLYPKTLVESIKELAEELNFNPDKLPIERYKEKEKVTKDLRSGKILVVPQEVMLEWSNIIEEYVSKGYGIISVPYSKVLTYEKSILVRELVNQIENHQDVGHEVLVYTGDFKSILYQELLNEINRRKLNIKYIK